MFNAETIISIQFFSNCNKSEFRFYFEIKCYLKLEKYETTQTFKAQFGSIFSINHQRFS